MNDNRFDFYGNGVNGWYNHGIYRPCAFHFCSGITRKNLIELNGFDESYANGICYDDNEFLYRINLKGLKIIFENDFKSIHQYHEKVNYIKDKLPDVVAFHIPNESKKSAFERYKHSLMGALKGCPDFAFMFPKYKSIESKEPRS